MSEKNSKEKAGKEIERLREKIHHHNYLYYTLDSPEISDAEYDELFRKLTKLEKIHPDLIAPDSPSQRVGAKPLASFQSVKHHIPMLSLDNVFNREEFEEFEKKIRRFLGVPPDTEIPYVCELKLDGLGVNLTYKNGIFTQGSTRGDGVKGEDITQNLRAVKSIPLRMRNLNPPQFMEIRGEVFLTKEELRRLNEERAKKDAPLFANTRNAAAGSLRQLDSSITASRRLDMFCYAAGHQEGIQFSLHSQFLEWLKDSGFKVNPYSRVCKNTQEVQAYWSEWREKAGSLSYSADGIVVKVNDMKLEKRLGSTSHAPRWAIAYKFPAEKKQSKVLAIRVQVGRTGKLTPVAKLEPVEIDGVVVVSATLHNADQIRRLDVRTGDVVEVRRAGGVIPEVVRVVRESRAGKEKKFQMPASCPLCGSPVARPKGEVDSYCTGETCPSRLERWLWHWCSRDAMDIQHIGPKLIQSLSDHRLVNDPVDFYFLKKEDLVSLERMAEKSAQNVLDEIEKSKSASLSRLIFALGIRHAGKRMAEILALHFHTLSRLSSANPEELLTVEGIGPEIAESIHEFFRKDWVKKLLKKLEKAGVKPEPDTIMGSLSSPFAGKTVVFTGSLSKFSRSEAEALLRKLGGKPSGSVSKQTHWVVIGKDPGSKLEKAKKMGISTLEEDSFLSLLKEAGISPP